MDAPLAMLRTKRDFAAFQSGASSKRHPLVAIRYRRNGLDATRFGFATGRTLGSAVVRNRVRRRLRAIIREMELNPGWDVLVSVRPAAATASYRELDAALNRLLRAGGIMKRKEKDT